MDWFFDRINSILKSLDNLFDDFFEDSYSTRYFRDRDFREAWEELDEFIKFGKFSERRTFSERLGQNAFKGSSGKHKIKINYGVGGLREDYSNLGVPPEASMEDIKKSYKKLLKKYHPDNYPEGSEKQKLATEITKKLNISYQRIKEYKQNNKI